MKEGIHPEYHEAKVRCACGQEYVVGSTIKEIRLDVCSNCHPFFTGKHKFVDTAGRVDKFFRKYGDNVEPTKKKKKKKRMKVLESERAEATDAPEEALDSSDAAEAREEETAPETAAEQDDGADAKDS